MTNIPYQPNPHTVAAKVLTFFRENPTKELTVIDIACKYETSGGTIRTELSKCVAAGLLVLARNDDLEPAYGAGPALLPQPAKRGRPAKAAAPDQPATPTETTMPKTIPAKRGAAQPTLDDYSTPYVPAMPAAKASQPAPLPAWGAWTPEIMAAIPIDTGIPVPVRNGGGAVDLSPLLTDLPVNSSRLLPLSVKASLAKAITRIHKQSGKKFTLWVNKPDQTLRVFRVS